MTCKTFQLTLALTLITATSTGLADICIATLGSVDPGSAAMLSMKKAKATADAMHEFARGTGNRVDDGRNDKENDAQITAEEASEGAKIGGQYTAESGPVFGAGAAKAFAMMKIREGTILTICAQRRSAQGAAQLANSAQNLAVAKKAAEADKVNGTLGFDAQVVNVANASNSSGAEAQNKLVVDETSY